MASKIYRRKAVEEITGLSRSTIYAMMDRDEFPRPIRLTRKAVGWTAQSVTDWLAGRETTKSEIKIIRDRAKVARESAN